MKKVLQSGNPLTDLITALSYFIVFLQVNFIPILQLIFTLVILLILSGIITQIIRRRTKRIGIPPNAVNGIVLAVRVIFLWIAVAVLTLFLPIELRPWILSVVGDASVIVGLAVGLAISLAMRNFVAGFYVMITDPFDVGDYVRIGSNEGIVREISLNYTKIRQMDGTLALIPNDTVMQSAVVNFRFEQKGQLETVKEPEIEEDLSIPRRIWNVLHKAVDPSKLIQYSFDLTFPIKPGLKHYETRLPAVMKRWTRKFGYRPLYTISSTSHLAFTYTFTIFVDEPKRLIDLRFDFVEDITRTVYEQKP